MGLLEDRERQREQSQRQLHALNGGWPFGDGPLQWFWHLEIRDGVHNDRVARQAHLVCEACGQAFFCLAPDLAAGPGFSVNGELLKSRVADHVLRSHPHRAGG